LSYTRAGVELTRRAGGLNPPRPAPFKHPAGRAHGRSGPLTGADSPPILVFPSTQRKEVIQCLLPSAVTSLGSPARPLSYGLASGRSQPWTSEQELERGGSHPAALSCWGYKLPSASRMISLEGWKPSCRKWTQAANWSGCARRSSSRC